MNNNTGNNTKSIMSKKNIIGTVISLLLILVIVLIIPKLPPSIDKLIDTTTFKIISIILIILLANNHLDLSIILLIMFLVIINKSSIKKILYKINKKSLDDTPIINTDLVPADFTQNTVPILESTTPVQSEQSDNAELNPRASSIIKNINQNVDIIIAQIKDDLDKFISTNIETENKLKKQLKASRTQAYTLYLNNLISKLLIFRNAAINIKNNNNVESNELLLKSLIKIDLLSDASKKVLTQNDGITSVHLQELALTHSNIIDTINIPIGQIDNSIIINTSDLHLKTTLNAVNYNNQIKESVSVTKQCSFKKEENNIILNNSPLGIPVEFASSNELYASIDPHNDDLVRTNDPHENQCIQKKPIDIIGWKNKK